MRQRKWPEELAWEVVLPGKHSVSTFGPKPCGTLFINEGQEGEERLPLPKHVAAILSAKQQSGEIHPASRDELLLMVEGLTHSCAKVRIERLIDRREYSRLEVVRKLCEEGFPEHVVRACVDRACEVGLISDARFADAFIRSKAHAGWGMARIANELKGRGIEVEELPGWPYEYLDPEAELERAADLARRHRVRGQRAYEKQVRYLCSRGFTTGVATQAVRRVMDEREEAYDLVDF